jgi:hypothetical protein
MKHLFSKRFSIVVLSAAFLFCSLFSSVVSAQEKETPDTVRYKALGCLYRAIQALNDRNVRFKSLQEELENMHPLEPQNMDSAHFKTNIAQSAKYLLFLEQHRTQLNKNIRVFSDSVHLLILQMNKDEEKKALEKFLSAYKQESAAFIGYSQRLSLMITDIKKALLFLQTVPMIHKGNDVVFNTDKSANEKYLDFESTISNEQMKVDQAIERSITLTEKENKIIVETTSLFNK